MLGLWWAVAQTQPTGTPDVITGAWYYLGVGALLVVGEAVAIKVLWGELRAWKSDYKALTKDDQSLYGRQIEVTEQSLAAHQESRKAVERLSDRVDHLTEEITRLTARSD